MTASDDAQAFPLTSYGIEVLEARRKQLEWSKARLARESGVPRETVSRILHGYFDTSAYVEQLCDAMKLPLYKLVPLPSEEIRLLDRFQEVRDLYGKDRRGLQGFLTRLERFIDGELALERGSIKRLSK
jgi:transcriptional regulator with XRE-family HTH domain